MADSDREVCNFKMPCLGTVAAFMQWPYSHGSIRENKFKRQMFPVYVGGGEETLP